MFEEIFFPRTAEKYRAAPLVEQRECYLLHLQETGASRTTLRICANDQLSLTRLLKLKDEARVGLAQIEAASDVWAQPKGRRCDQLASAKTKARYVGHAVRWLRFLGWLDTVEKASSRHGGQLDAYEEWMRRERGLSETTIQSSRSSIDQFFGWLDAADIPLAGVKITDIDRAMDDKRARGTCGRRTMHSYAQRLRAFFQFAEARGWSVPGLAGGIMAPSFRLEEGVPKGLKREDVVRLLATTEGQRPTDIRDRAILMLFIAYGLRAAEVRCLRVDDIDWEKEILRVYSAKSMRTQTYPLSRGVGHAILRYIRDVRPSGFGRTLFLTKRAPIGPFGRTALGRMVSCRLADLGIATGKRGTHALRHATAQHLLDQGVGMKVIGDFLGHRDPSSTAIYAKVNLAALREVMALDVEGLA